jgi:DNA gyrase subunit A
MTPNDDDLPNPPAELPGATPPESRDIDLEIDDDLRSSYLSYAMSVIISRALPDVRDGLKPSQRRLLLAMHDLNLHSRAKAVKCAKIAGDTQGNYHPHGQEVIYPTLVRMAQSFSLRYPLVDGQGNFGNIDGLPAAAMRYTEARMSPVAEELLADIDKDTVDTVMNYDERQKEAVVLPGRFPNLICNGAQGIAVGMATSIPPHNFLEICDAILLLLHKPDATLPELLAIVPGPDFPTGGVICGRRGIVEGYRTGRSTLTLRAKHEFVEAKNGRTNIVFTEIPYGQQKMKLVDRIAQAFRDEKVKGLSNVEDHSNREGIRIVVELRRDADPNVVLNQLFTFTPLQDTVSVIMLSIVNNRPMTLSLKAMLQEFIKHRQNVIRRRTLYLLRMARNRAHVLEGLLIALASIDEVIRRIRASKDVPEARASLLALEVSAALMERALGADGYKALTVLIGEKPSYNLSRVQADTILQMRLSQLTALENDKVFAEYREKRDEIAEYERILSSEANILELIRQDMLELKKRFPDKRRTEIIDAAGDVSMEDLIADEMNVVTISQAGYIKRLPLVEYRTQARGGKGVTGTQMKEGDVVEGLFVASSHAYILFFTNRGQCHWLKVWDIPAMGRTAQGRAIINLLPLKPEERITSRVPVRTFDDRGLFMVTRRGIVKKTALVAYSRPKQGGIIGISLNEGDELIEVLLTGPGDHVILATKNGMSIRFDEKRARNMGRNTTGVKGIELEEGDEVVGAVVASPNDSLLTVCEKGYGKRTAFSEYREQNRGGKGLIDIKTTDRNGSVVAIASVKNGDEVMLMSAGGMTVRIPVDGVSVIGRNTQGVRLMNIDAEDRVSALAKIASEDVAEEEVAVAEEEAKKAATPLPDVIEGDVPEPEIEAEGEADAGEE